MSRRFLFAKSLFKHTCHLWILKVFDRWSLSLFVVYMVTPTLNASDTLTY
jgi:hypothetical protein